MEFSDHAIFVCSLLALASILASPVAHRTGAPLLLVFLGIGMLAGENGPGHIHFHNFEATYLVGTVALAVILFDGGMRTHTETFRVGLRPALSLATLGVVLTAGAVGAAAAWALDMDWMQGMLLGSIVGSTDAAAVFSLLHARGMRLKQRVGATLEIESGCNDPMAVFLTLVFIEAVKTQGGNLGVATVLQFAREFGLGAVLGLTGGRLLARLIGRVELTPGLYPLLAAAGGLGIYAGTLLAGGSGFLAIYLAGIVLGNSRVHSAGTIFKVHDGLAWLAQITLFLLLGLLVTPRALLPSALEALLIALVLIFVARPFATWICLLPFRFPWREQLFIGWVGLRGAVPIVLATFPVLGGLPDAQIYFNVAFFVVLTSLAIQGWTVAPLAQRLGLMLPPAHAPLFSEMLEVPGQTGLRMLAWHVNAESPALGRQVSQLPLPEGVRVAAVFRNAAALEAIGHVEIAAGDLLYVITRDEDVPVLERLFVPEDAAEESAQAQYFGSFTLSGEARLGDIAEVYGVEVPQAIHALTVSEYLDRRFRGRAVVGDRLRLGAMELVVREVEGRRVTRIGVRVALPASR
ncbi:MAG TPA: potassium/proton antiporter [Burkholderiales bacterium]|nr:potassium/proton antiporter [Burkholderiales bacterium]